MFRLLGPWALAAMTCAAQCTLTLTPNLPTAAVGAAYPGTIGRSGTAPWSQSVGTGSLPPGLSLSNNGTMVGFAGTPTAAGTYDFSINMSDGASCTGSGSFRIVVGGELGVSPAALSNGAVGRGYGQSLGLLAGSIPLGVTSASLLSGSMPPGLSLVGSGAQWTVSGTPSQTGTYDFTLQVSGGGYSASRRYVVSITAAPQLIPNPSSLRVLTRLGENPTPPQRLDVTASDGGNYRYRVTASNPGFRIEGAAGEYTTPFSINPNIQPQTYAPGQYLGYLELTAIDGASSSLRIPVELIVNPPPTLLVDQTALTVSMRQNDPPVTRGFSVTSSDEKLTYTVEALTPMGGNWLTMTPVMGETPANVTAVFNPVGLAPGNYAGTIRVSASRNGIPAVGSGKTLVVNLAVDQPVQPTGFSASPASLLFTSQVGNTPISGQTLRIENTGSAVSWSATATEPWVAISALTGTTPSDVSIGVYPAGLAAGTYTANVRFQSGDAVAVVPVTVTLTGTLPPVNPNVRVWPEAVDGYVTPESPKMSWNVNVDSTGRQYRVEYNPTVSWLKTSFPGGTTPTGFTLTADATGLPPGIHRGAVVVVSADEAGGRASIAVNVVLTVGNPASAGPGVLTPSRSLLFFDWRQGSGGLPGGQTLFLTSPGQPVNWDASTTVSWLNLSKSSGTTPSEMDVTVSPQFLGAGTYRGEIRFRRGTDEVSIVTVVLTVGGPGALRADPAVLVFLVESGRDVAPQLFDVGRFDSTAQVNYTVRSVPEWLTVSPPSGLTPARMEAVVKKDRLPQATTSVIRMEGEIAIESEAGGVRVPVLLTIVPPQGSPSDREAPWILSVTNAASTQPGAVAPGEHVTLYGGFEGREVRVWFDSNRAALLEQKASQLTVAVPFALAGRASTRVRVEVDSLTSRDLELRVADTAPGIFTVSGSGRGFAAAFHEDGSKNSESPSAPGSIAWLDMTGLGVTDPAGIDGDLIRDEGGPRAVAPVEIRIAGLVAETITCYAPPGTIQGYMRCVFRVPPGIEGGDHPVVVSAGGVTSQPGVLFRVK